MKPDISIIIPIYNADRYLEECLGSIRRQSHGNFEVIMIDDGSGDGSADICKRYAEADSRFVYIHKENGGVSSARNEGLEMAKGIWVSFVDADDIVSEEYLASFLDTEEKADITFFGLNAFRSDGSSELRVPHEVYADNRDGAEEALYQLKCGDPSDMLGYTWNKFFRSSIIKEHHIRFSAKLKFREDEIFTLEYCRHITSARVIARPLYQYRIVETGLTSRGPSLQDMISLSESLTENLRFYNHPALCEFLLKNATDYRATHLYKSPLAELSSLLRDYVKMTEQYPQPDRMYGVNSLTKFLKKGFWAAYLYCLIRKL